VFNPFQGLPSKKIDSQLNHNYTFANFVEGGCNLLARSAGMTIAKQPGRNTFNPLFIYGGSGLGKTHLANAIGLEAERLNPNLNVLYVSANKFQTQYMEATRNNKSTDFLNFYQSLDVLIVDDIQDMASRTGTQNTFFHIFNHLHQAGKQLILTSDQSPNVLQGLDHRILSRFKWGLSAELVPPDFNTKKGILLNKVKAEGLLIPEDVVDYIAGAVTDNVRELEGVVSSLLAQSILINAEINLDLAQKVVGKIANTTTKVVNISKIQEVVCDYYNLEVNDIQTKSRKRVVVQARQVAMYLARKYTKNSLTAIGELIGNRDHATVLHACKTVAEQSEIDKELKQSLDSIEEKLR
jgi:chromosomal replication initiator protein